MVKIAGVDDFLPPKQTAPTLIEPAGASTSDRIIDGIIKILDHPTAQSLVATVAQRVQFVTAQQAAKAQQEQAGNEQAHNAVLFED